MWTPDTVDRLKGCFECTDWDALVSSDLDESVSVVTDYINWCVDKEIPKKTIKRYPNSKPWVSKAMKDLTLKKRDAYLNSKDSEGKDIQKEIKQQITRDRADYKDKTEAKFREGNMRDAWEGLKKMSGQHKTKDNGGGPQDSKENDEFVSQLNDFYCRFDKHDFKTELNTTIDSVTQTIGKTETINESEDITPRVVENCLLKLNARKAAGPDNLGGKVLKECATQLATVFATLFNMSLHSNIVPTPWKQSTICPVPKKKKPGRVE